MYLKLVLLELQVVVQLQRVRRHWLPSDNSHRPVGRNGLDLNGLGLGCSGPPWHSLQRQRNWVRSTQ